MRFDHNGISTYSNVVNVKIVLEFCSLDPLENVVSSYVGIGVGAATAIANLEQANTRTLHVKCIFKCNVCLPCFVVNGTIS